MTIGSWVRRQPDGRWHLVESVVADAAITHCGRRMEPLTLVTLAGLDVSIGKPPPDTNPVLCRRCEPA